MMMTGGGCWRRRIDGVAAVVAGIIISASVSRYKDRDNGLRGLIFYRWQNVTKLNCLQRVFDLGC